MVKMEFLKRKHFSLWIITTFVLVAGILDGCVGLQGVPTWICLGVKSPFIEFSNEVEVLANSSVPLNITKDEQALMHQEGLRKLGTFIKPVDLRDSATGFVKADLTKKIPNTAASTSNNAHYGGGGIVMAQRRRHPIQEEMDQKQIILLDEDTDENGLPTSLTDEDRKFIVPMALKNASPDPRTLMATQRLVGTTTRATTTTTTTRRPTTPATPEFASNIDDLKKHILFLQNLTKHDSNFQSKFVVFPSLQKDRQTPVLATTTTTARPFRSIFQYSAPVTPPTRKSGFPSGAKLPGGQPFGGYYHNDDEDDGGMSVFLSQAGMNTRDKITIVPQVLLLNDQTIKNDTSGGDARGRNADKTAAGMPQTVASTTPTTPETTTPMTSTTPRRPTKKPLCIRNPDSPKCIRQRKREEQQRQRHREQLLREQREYLRPHYEPYIQTLNNTKRFAVSIEIPDSFKIHYNESAEATTLPTIHVDEGELQELSRSKRSHHKRRNIGGGQQGRRAGNNDKFAAKYSTSYFERDTVITGARDIAADQSSMPAINGSTPSPTVPAYSEPIDLNPDNCYQVDGMTYGQKKQCVLHTSVMPAISRGARAAIQECQFQFKNLRWNCSTTDDNTVFGPVTGLGSPEMAFIHALAAAMVTSFIARACRDGQLASCGCSRGSRPKQLHDDWTWGGCGDNLEFAYKFAVDFIDVREKETRRGTRGAGNPERKRGRFHQRRNQQMQQTMQADDASAAGLAVSATTTLKTLATTTTTTTTTTAATPVAQLEAFASENEYISSDKENMQQQKQLFQQQQQQQQQQISNKTVSVDGNQHSNGKNDAQAAGNNTNMSTATLTNSKDTVNTQATTRTAAMATAQKSAPSRGSSSSSGNNNRQQSNRDANADFSSEEEAAARRIKPEDLLELQERITKEILNSKLQGKEMQELQEKINREILNTKVFNMDAGGGGGGKRKRRRKNQRAINGMPNDQQADATANGAAGDGGGAEGAGKWKNIVAAKARSLMNLHNNEAGRRAVLKKTRITCKCHGVSGSCSLITCWQQLSSIREIGDYLREKYEEATVVKLNKRGRLQVKDTQYKMPTSHDLVYLDESPDWCRNSRQLQWPGTHGRVCNKTSAGLDGCGILCCGRGYNTKNIVVRERCNCKFHWCCQVKCDVCVKVLEEHTCK